MKSFKINTKLASISSLILLLSAVVAWSPPTGEDIIVTTGTPALVLGASNTFTTGTSLRGAVIGGSNVTETYGGYSVIVGGTNEVKAASSVVVGTYNDIALDATSISETLVNSGVFGYANVANKGSDSCLVGGKVNSFYAVSSLIAGHDNDLRGAGVGDITSYSAAIGQFNEIYANSGWVVGYDSTVTANRGLALGTGTTSSEESATAIGKYNADMVPGDVLVVGTGTGVSNKKTSLTVREDGSVVLGNANSGNVVLTKAQGDISMGVYQ